MNTATSNLEQGGFALFPAVLEKQAVEKLLALLGPVNGAGRRGLLAVPEVSALAWSPRVLNLVRPHLPQEPLPVRTLYFDKSPEANWLVPWHQDLTLAVRERVDVPGFGPWSAKEGVPHVQPPVGLLERMLAVRVHLDDAGTDNGALRVLPGTHRLGRLSAERIQELRATVPEQTCVARAGDALLMRPLLLHASARSESGRHRRVLHFEYAAFELPPSLRWHEMN